jgi:hypothetical protein
MGLPYKMVTGFPGTADINKAMLQAEVNVAASSLPGYQTQVIPQIIKPGIGMPLFQLPFFGPDGNPAGSPALKAQGFELFEDVYAEAFGKRPSGPKEDALVMLNDVGTQLQRGLVFPKGTPADAVEALRGAVRKVAADPDFQADYEKVTSQKPDLVTAEELAPLFERLRHLDPAIKKTLADNIAE